MRPVQFKPKGGLWTAVRGPSAVVQRAGNWQSLFDHAIDSSTGTALTRPYAQSVWVMRAIKTVSAPIAAVPLQFSAIKRGDADSAIDDPVLSMLWENPAVGLTWFDFVEATVGWLKLAGEAFWILDDSFLRPFPEVAGRNTTPLILARPDRMKAVVENGKLLGWEWTNDARSRMALLPDQVVHLKFLNPYDPIRGLSEYEAAMIATEADYLAGKFNLNANRNNGDRGVYVVAKAGMPSDEQIQQITQQLRQKRDAALRGEFRPVFIAGDVSVEDPKVQLPDASFSVNRLQNRHEIYAAFGVPLSMADNVAVYSVGSASDRYRLIEDTCLPLGCKITGAIETVERRRTGKAMYAWLNWDEHSVMQAARNERMQIAFGLFDRGRSWKEINELLSLGMKPSPTWEVGYLPFSVAPVSGREEPVESPVEDEDYGEVELPPTNGTNGANGAAHPSAVRSMLAVLRGKDPEDGGESGDEFQRARSRREVRQWEGHMRRRMPTVKAFQSKITRALFHARAEVLRKLEIAAPAAAGIGVTRAAAVDFLFDPDDLANEIKAGLAPLYRSALHTAGAEMLRELGKDDPWTMPPEKAIEFIRNRENKLSGVADDVWNAMKEILEDGFTSGDSSAAMAKTIREKFNEISKGRAKVIAINETNTAYGAARQEALRTSGIRFKQWLTSGNANVRESHAAANGQIVPVGAPFEVGGEQLDFPGDPKGSPENVINCRCVSVAVEKGPEE